MSSLVISNSPSVHQNQHAPSNDNKQQRTAEAKAAFASDPVGMLPQFGGFCAFGVYVGKKLDGDVRYADIVDGKLYLFVNQTIFEKYLEDKQTVIDGAFAKWPDIMATPIGEL